MKKNRQINCEMDKRVLKWTLELTVANFSVERRRGDVGGPAVVGDSVVVPAADDDDGGDDGAAQRKLQESGLHQVASSGDFFWNVPCGNFLIYTVKDQPENFGLNSSI
jgi:hypothetical protein